MKRKARYFIKVYDSVYKINNPSLLCQDGKLREFVWFGTVTSCLKIYRSEGWAIRKALQLVQRGGAATAVVCSAYAGETISNRGEIIKPKTSARPAFTSGGRGGYFNH